VPRDLETIVHKAMERDADRRYPTGRRAGGRLAPLRGGQADPRRRHQSGRAGPGAGAGATRWWRAPWARPRWRW
jgi:hypothetical protein